MELGGDKKVWATRRRERQYQRERRLRDAGCVQRVCAHSLLEEGNRIIRHALL